MLAELERIPFDLPEAESEIVAGWLTEFSGMMYGLVQLGTYLKLYAFAALFVVLFLGGWNGPMVVPPFPEKLLLMELKWVLLLLKLMDWDQYLIQ